LGLNLKFDGFGTCVKATIKINKDQQVCDYALTNWNFIPNTMVATEMTDDQIVMTISSNTPFTLNGEHTLRFLPLEGDESCLFALDSVVVEDTAGEISSSDCYGMAVVSCKNQTVTGRVRDRVQQGETFYGTVTLAPEVCLAVFGFDLVYDSDIFEVKLHKILKENVTAATETQNGVVSVKLDAQNDNAIEEGDVAVFEFTALNSGRGYVQVAGVEATYCVDGSSDILYNPSSVMNMEGKEIDVVSSRPQLRMDDVDTTLNSTYTVNVNINSIEDLKSFEIYLDFNDEHSADPEVRFSPELENFKTLVNMEADWSGKELRITGVASESVELIGEDMISIQFTARKSGIAYVMFDAKTVLRDSSGADIVVDTDDTCRISIQ